MGLLGYKGQQNTGPSALAGVQLTVRQAKVLFNSPDRRRARAGIGARFYAC